MCSRNIWEKSGTVWVMRGKCKDHSLGRTSSGAQIGQFQVAFLQHWFWGQLGAKAQWRLLAWLHGRSHSALGVTSNVSLRRLPTPPALSPTYLVCKSGVINVCSFCCLGGELIEKLTLKCSHKCRRVTSPLAISKCWLGSGWQHENPLRALSKLVWSPGGNSDSGGLGWGPSMCVF